MTSSVPVQMAMNPNSRKQVNGNMGVPSPHSIVQNSNSSNVLAETTAGTWMAVGSLAESLGDLDKALVSYESALRHSPNNPDILTKVANVYRVKDVFFKAAEYYERALNFNPENGETWGLLGHCYLMLDDLQRAYAAYQRALYYLENPNVPKLWHGIGILYDRYGSLEYAEEAFVRVLELDPNFEKSNEIYFRLGIIYKHQGKLQAALECFQYILNNPPHPLTQPDVWFQIGSVLEQQKDWSSAKEAYEKVLQVNPQHAKVLQQLGCLYSQSDAPTATPNAGSSSQSFHQDLNIALKYFLQSLEIDQADAHTWYYLGRVHMMRGDFDAAYEAFQQAVNRDSRNPTFWCSIGVLYYQIAQYRDALDAYTRAIRLNPYISEVWYDLGTLYETCNNQISDALDAYRQAERLDPGNPHIKARLEQLLKYQQDGKSSPPSQIPSNQHPKIPQEIILESNPNHQVHHPQGQLTQGQQPQATPGSHPSALAPTGGQTASFSVNQMQAQNLPPVQSHPVPPPIAPLKADNKGELPQIQANIAPTPRAPHEAIKLLHELPKTSTVKTVEVSVPKETSALTPKKVSNSKIEDVAQVSKHDLDDKQDNNPTKKQVAGKSSPPGDSIFEGGKTKEISSKQVSTPENIPGNVSNISKPLLPHIKVTEASNVNDETKNTGISSTEDSAQASEITNGNSATTTEGSTSSPKETKEPTEPKETKETKETKEAEEIKGIKEVKETKEEVVEPPLRSVEEDENYDED